MAKRAALSSPDAEDIYTLSPTDAGAFTSARSDTSSRLGALFADVNAPEFQDPRALTPSGSPHPGSIVERFDAWRRRYPDEYSGAWGGLALAGVWEFWARKEMGAWDVLRAAAPLGKAAAGTDENEKDLGPAGLDEFAWHAGLTHYAEAHVDLGPVGGDDETIGTIVSNVVVPRLISFVERGAYDPFSSRETRAAVEMVEQVGYVLERHGWRFQVSPRSFL